VSAQTTENYAISFRVLLNLKPIRRRRKKNKKTETAVEKEEQGFLDPRGSKDQQLGRILETVNSDNKKSLTRRSHRRVFLFWSPKFAHGAARRGDSGTAGNYH
jgi:hypothetical protein